MALGTQAHYSTEAFHTLSKGSDRRNPLAMPQQKAQILIVDDHPVMRQGLAQLIQDRPDLEVCGQAEGIADARRIIPLGRPDLVIIDLSLRDGHGLDLIKELRESKHCPKMLVVSMHEDVYYAERALRAGASGYVAKSEAVNDVVDAIYQVLRGTLYLNPRMASRMLGGIVGRRPQPGGAAPEEILTDRELQVFELLGQGLNSREIGEKLTLSSKTIDTYREHIKDKLGLRSGNELIVRAVLWANER